MNKGQFNSFNDNVFLRQNTSKSQNDIMTNEYSQSRLESQIENKKVFNPVISTDSIEIQVNKNNFQFNNVNVHNNINSNNNSHK